MNARYLRRYTELPALIQMPSERRITLISNAQWKKPGETAS